MADWRRLDFHIHTHHSPCASAEMTPEAILAEAKARGLAAIGITDHAERQIGFGFFSLLPEEFADPPPGLDVFLGCETSLYAPGDPHITEEFASKMDYVLLSFNHFHDPASTMQPETYDVRSCKALYLSMFRAAAECPLADVISHPFHVYPGGLHPDTLDETSDAEMGEVLEVVRAVGVALEINASTLRAGQQETQERFYRLAASMGIRFSIGSDSHRLSRIGSYAHIADFVAGLGLAEGRIWLPRCAVEA
jgi:histidinol phosphatase-like PHP family hydrolase